MRFDKVKIKWDLTKWLKRAVRLTIWCENIKAWLKENRFSADKLEQSMNWTENILDYEAMQNRKPSYFRQPAIYTRKSLLKLFLYSDGKDGLWEPDHGYLPNEPIFWQISEQRENETGRVCRSPKCGDIFPQNDLVIKKLAEEMGIIDGDGYLSKEGKKLPKIKYILENDTETRRYVENL